MFDQPIFRTKAEIAALTCDRSAVHVVDGRAIKRENPMPPLNQSAPMNFDALKAKIESSKYQDSKADLARTTASCACVG